MSETKSGKRIHEEIFRKIAVFALAFALVMTSFPADTIHAEDNDIQIRKFSTEVRSGGTLTDGKYVWTATNNNADHRFTYRLNYEVSGTYDFEPGTVNFRVPKRLLKNREGEYEDYYDISVPKQSEEDLPDDTKYVYYEDGDDIVITNYSSVPAGESGFIELSYLTAGRTFDYQDMAPSDIFEATLTIEQDSASDTKTASSDSVYIDTSAKVMSTEKRTPKLYRSWQTKWGDDAKPEDNGDYYYLVWEVRTRIKNPSQPYNFSLEDIFDVNEGGEVIGYKMQGEKTYRTDSLVEDIRKTNNFDEPYEDRYDYVLTKHPKSIYAGLDYYEMINHIKATVDPVDQVDEDSTAQSSKDWIYDRPSFSGGPGYFDVWKWGLDYNNDHALDSEYIRNFELSNLQSGSKDRIENLRYDTYIVGYPYPYTVDGDSTDPENYGKKTVTYVMQDEELKIEGRDTALTKDDYEFGSLSFRIALREGVFNEDTQVFDAVSATYKDEDVIDFYVEIEESGEYVKAGTYHLKTNEWTDLADIVKEADGKNISFNEGVTGWRAETTNAYYYTELHVYPCVSLKGSSDVLESIADKEKIYLENKVTGKVYKEDGTQIMDDYMSSKDYLIGVTKDGHIKKSITNYENNKAKKLYTITWLASAYEDYKNTQGERQTTKQAAGGKFYDLLPEGCTLVKSSIKAYAGETTLANGEYSYSVIENFRNSGRALLIVEIDATCEEPMIEYQTAHSWDDIKDYGTNVVNNIAYETANDSIGDGLPDTGGGNDLLADLDPDTDDAKFLYATQSHTIGIITAANFGLYKKVKASKDESYVAETLTYQSRNYSYQIRFATDSESKSKDMILFDSLENYVVAAGENAGEESAWHGTLQRVDTSHAEACGAAPVVYYSTIENLDIEQHHDLEEEIEGEKVWKTEEEIGDISLAKAVAIDLRKDENGNDFILGFDSSISIKIEMLSPAEDNTEQGHDKAYNNVWMSNTTVSKEGYEASDLIHQDYTQITYRVVGDVEFDKVASYDHDEKIKGITFRLWGTSDYGTEISEEYVSNSRGEVRFDKIEKGSYMIQEIENDPDWIEDREVRYATVDAAGNVTIEGMDLENGVYVFENDPRVHKDLKFVKKNFIGNQDKTTNMSIGNCIFKLSGTSDYGTEVTEYKISDVFGNVTFDNLEKGTYQLKEVAANDAYVLNDAAYTVKIDENGILAIENETDPQDEMLLQTIGGDIYIFNEPKHDFSIRKRDAVNSSEWLSGAEFSLTGTSYNGEHVDKTVTSDSYGRAHFEGLESGRYVLKETKAPKRHLLDETERIVTIDKEGDITIPGLETEASTGFFIIDNERTAEGNITITKKWKDNLTGSDAENRQEPVVHIETEEPDVFNGYIVTYDANGGEFNGGDTKNLVRIMPGTPNEVVGGTVKDPMEYDPVHMKYFDGWYKDRYGHHPFDITNDVIGSDITVYAKWSDGQAYAVFDSDDGSLKFFREKEGEYTNGQTDGTKTYYTNFENVQFSTIGSVPWHAVRGAVKSVTFEDTIKPVSTAHWFEEFTNTAIQTLDLTGLDTSRTTSMARMFYHMANVKTIVASGLDTSSVTDMSEMFMQCYTLQTVDVSGFDTSNVTTMYYMFNDCNSLQAIDVSGFETGKVTTFQDMFTRCKKLKTIDVTNFDTSKANVRAMFYECSGLLSIDVSGFDTSASPSFYKMFAKCSSLEELDLSNFNTDGQDNSQYGKWMRYSFESCTKLKRLDMSGMELRKSDNFAGLFRNCPNLEVIDISGLRPENVTNMTQMFYNCPKLTTIYVSDRWTTESVTSSDSMFTSCYNLPNFDTAYTDVSKANYGNEGYLTYKACALDASQNGLLNMAQNLMQNIGAAEERSGRGHAYAVLQSNGEFIFFRSTEKYTNDTTGTFEDILGNTYAGRVFSGFEHDTSGTAKWANHAYEIRDVSVASGQKIIPDNTSKWFDGCINMETVQTTGLDTKNSNSMSFMFRDCTAIESIDLSSFDTGNATSMESMFEGCEGLQALDITTFDTSGTTNMKNMFKGCESLQSVNTGSFDTSKVNNMSGMYSGCSSMEQIDMSGFDTASVTDFSELFSGCSSLTNVNLSDIDTSSAQDMHNMFKGCSALSSLPALSFDTSNVMNMQSMFDGCGALAEIDLSSFSTESLTNMKDMFRDCTILKSIDISGFDTSDVTDMSNMITDCGVETIALGAETLLDSSVGDNAEWVKYAELSGDRVMDAESVDSLSQINGIPGWYKTTDAEISPSQNIKEEYESKQGTHENVEWVKVSDDTWTYTFNVYDETDKYYAYEEAITNYESTATFDDPVVINGEDGSNIASATITNTKETYVPPAEEFGHIDITASVVGEEITESDLQHEFTYTLTLSGRTGTEVINGVIFEDGVGTFYLKHGEHFIIRDLPPGTHYTVTEGDLGKFERVSKENDENDIIANYTQYVPYVYTFTTPTVNVNNFTLKKEIKGTGADANEEFTFLVSFSGLQGNKEYEFVSGEPFTTDAEGESNQTITLKGGEEITFTSVPVGTKYQITESASSYTAGYKVIDAAGGTTNIAKTTDQNLEEEKILTTGKETVDDGEEITVTFTNEKTMNVPTGVDQKWNILLMLLLMIAALMAIYVKKRYRKGLEESHPLRHQLDTKSLTVMAWRRIYLVYCKTKSHE